MIFREPRNKNGLKVIIIRLKYKRVIMRIEIQQKEPIRVGPIIFLYFRRVATIM